MKRPTQGKTLLAVVAGVLIGLSAWGSKTDLASGEEHERELAMRAKLAPSGTVSAPASPEGGATSAAPVVSYAVAMSQSQRFSQLAPGLPTLAPQTEEHELGVVRPSHAHAPGFRDPVLQAQQPLASAPAPIATFEGISQPEACAGCIPPDTTGAVGKTQYVQMVNEHLAVFDKTTGQLQGSVRAINTLFASLPGTGKNCRTENNGDPIVIYDQLADRWMVSQFAVPGGADGYHECIAVSKTGDATGEYWIYDFKVGDASNFHDYPHLGLWPDAYYMSTHVFDPNNSRGAGAFAFEREKMLAGQLPRMIYVPMYAANASFWGHLPATLDGMTPPPAGSPGIFVEVDESAEIGPVDAMRIWKFHVDWTNPAASTFGVSGQPNNVLPVADFNRPLCVAGLDIVGCIPQPASYTQLDTIGDRLMYRAAYRNFGDHESLVLNHTVEADSTTLQSGPRWYEVRGLSGASPSIYQQGTFAPSGPTDLLYRWMGSIAMDQSGDIAIGYSTSSNINMPSIAYAGRLANDALGQLTQGETQMFAGGGPQNPYGFVGVGRLGRWGDYSTMTVDPVDDCTFWFTTEYFPSPADDPVGHVLTEWHTRVGNFKFPNCQPSTNLLPQSTLTANRTTGSAPLAVDFAFNTSDPNPGDTVTFDLDFGDGSPHVTSGTTASHTYAEGAWVARLTATDNHGAQNSSTVNIVATGTGGSSGGPACTLPGVQAVADDGLFIGLPSTSVPVNAGYDVHAIWMAEPYEGPTEHLVISLDLDSLTTAQAPGSVFYVDFTTDDGTNWYTYFNSTNNISGQGVAFGYGIKTPGTGGTSSLANKGATDTGSHLDTDHNRIVWYVKKSDITTLAGSHALSVDGESGTQLPGLPVVFGGFSFGWDVSSTGNYTLVGNSSCAPPPVNRAPTASLTPANATITAGQPVSFTVAGADADAGDTLSYDLNFGDGTAHGTAAGPVSHTYASAGSYTATLTVTDNHSATGTATSAITVNAVQVNHAPTASLTPASSTIDAGQAVSFTVSGTDPDSGDTLSYDLNFGDGSAHSAASGAVSHTYTTAGSYTATLTVSDGHGGSDAKTSSITVQQPTTGALSVTLASDKAGGDVSNGPVTVTFTAHATGADGTPLQYTFAFGDGATSTMTTGANTISHAYAYAGTYHPYVTVTEDYGAKAATSGADEDVITTTTSVSVTGSAAARLSYSLPNGNVAPVDVVFDTSGSTGDRYGISFGDGAVVTGTGTPPASITHRYLSPGSYNVTLSMTSGTDTVSDSQTVQIMATQQLTAELLVTPTHGTSPLTVTLDGCHSIAANDGSKIASFTMDFGDGSTPVTQTVDATHGVDCSAADRSADPSLFQHTYTATGTFVPTLTVTDDSATPRTAQAKALGGVSVQPKKVAASGGGAFGLMTVLPLMAAGLARRRRKMPA